MSFGSEFSEDFCNGETSIARVEEADQEPGIEADREVLSTEQVFQHMVSNISQLSEIVKLPFTTVRILLNHFQWDEDKLMEAFYEKGPAKLFKEVNLRAPKNVAPSVEAKKEQEECEVCYQTCSPQMTSLACGHHFCNSCWCKYLTTKIMTDGDCETIRCPGFQCEELVDDDTVKRLVTEKKTQLRYKHLITNSFVMCHRLIKWCPAPDCTNAVKVSMSRTGTVRCSCGHLFCFSCLEDWHNPVQCEQLKNWLKKCSDDSETLNWVHVNTKECPKCQAFIEKNGGCNHMTCRKCSQHFCWVCLKPFNTGTYRHTCNQFEERSTSNQRKDLERYIFYYNRYNNHQKSIELESVLRDKIRQSDDKVSHQFLKTAVDILYKCRHTLMYTYIFGYYTSKNTEKEIFEDNQTDLENATERLSAYLEGQEALSDKIESNFRQKVVDCMKYCDQRRKVLLLHVREGNEQGTWAYNG